MPDLPADYRFVFHNLPGNYLLLTADGTIVDQSERHVAVSMRNREDTIGRNVFEAYPSSPESQQQLLDSFEQVRRTLQPHTVSLRYDLKQAEEQGGSTEERHWHATHYPLLSKTGELVYILQDTADVTQQQVAS